MLKVNENAIKIAELIKQRHALLEEIRSIVTDAEEMDVDDGCCYDEAFIVPNCEETEDCFYPSNMSRIFNTETANDYYVYQSRQGEDWYTGYIYYKLDDNGTFLCVPFDC